MKQVSKAATCVVLVVCLLTTNSSAEPLTGNEIKSVIGDKTVVLQTSLGSMPLTYGSSGVVTGDGSGSGLGKFFAPKESGTWWVKGSSMCQKFKTWYKGRTFCFTLEATGAGKLKWVRDDGYSGTAVIR